MSAEVLGRPCNSTPTWASNSISRWRSWRPCRNAAPSAGDRAEHLGTIRAPRTNRRIPARRPAELVESGQPRRSAWMLIPRCWWWCHGRAGYPPVLGRPCGLNAEPGRRPRQAGTRILATLTGTPAPRRGDRADAWAPSAPSGRSPNSSGFEREQPRTRAGHWWCHDTPPQPLPPRPGRRKRKTRSMRLKEARPPPKPSRRLICIAGHLGGAAAGEVVRLPDDAEVTEF